MIAVHNGKHSIAESRRLIHSIIIVAITMFMEVIGGIISHSLALLSDAGHMLIDLFALVLSWIAHKFSTKKSDLQRSYGYHRLQIIAAFVNGLTLFFISVIIIIESIKRFIFPVNIEWGIMLIVATLGLIANIIVFFILHSKCESNINIKSAVLHVIGDILGSIAAIFASMVIMLTGWQVVDPILSVFVSIVILNSGYKILKSSCHVLLEGTPEGVSAEGIKSEIVSKLPEVIDVHHIHAWSLSDNYFIITMHAKVRQDAQHTDILYEIKKILLSEFEIAHSTVEIEYDECADDKILKI
ncbi:cation diffusion facilitator family transporter [Wolbachia endosymbiont of Dirofilaria (Dirofilaria) immitis]|uniref:cation diffusion facilitator family transporter n=1 Tax=Wolbachia endosymbiont of Dirofilaria (Dirofilaria) immitis TaxID=1812115 RepID=UPI00158A1443|nr:cation diffusion facilitator family transporter [Wolbachia endosymbiont of Dirofilaria (Dirofilaria) immitis]QKX02586.1 cation diffusion facilitator family transporter [Wolbachia endosymbiont of Dirofilaria (Dirofilaria) immitis]